MTITAWQVAADTLDPPDVPADERWATPGALNRHLDPNAWQYPHLDLIDRYLLRLEQGTLGTRGLMILMQPRAGKSRRVSRHFPLWYLRKHPNHPLILTSYGAHLAARHSRWIRNTIAAHPELGLRLAADSKAADEWQLAGHDGGVRAVGVGGGVTGTGGMVIIDDPVKNREEAESQQMRDKTWDWWTDDLSPRLTHVDESEPWALLMMCMTGDTPVLRLDGATTPLRDIRPGDEIASYSEGSLTSATVRNWANKGPDSVYAIRLKSGRTVRANARHPFLVVDENGVESWVRLASLRAGMKVRSVEAPTAESVASSQGVSSQPSARACACPTTTRRAGRPGIERLPTTPNQRGRCASGADMDSPLRITIESWRSKTASAQSAAASLWRSTSRSTGPTSSASTTTMTLERCEVCSATTATSSWLEDIPRRSSTRPLATWTVGLDEIVQITSAGVEDVFDIQVDPTQLFIANGLCSHNTRWHEDDLGGRLLVEEPEHWTVLTLPAIAEEDDPLGRPAGGLLMPDRYGEAWIAEQQARLGAYGFEALYQQRPRPAEGALFKKHNFRYWHRTTDGAGSEVWQVGERTVRPEECWRFATCDTATSKRTSADWSVVAAWAVTPHGDLLLVDRDRRRLEEGGLLDFVRGMKDKYGCAWVGVEATFTTSKLAYDMGVSGIPLVPLTADVDKVTRSIPAQVRSEQHRVFWPAGAPWLDEWEAELLAFNHGAHDDQVDVFSYAALRLDVRVPVGGGDKPMSEVDRITKALEDRTKARRSATPFGA